MIFKSSYISHISGVLKTYSFRSLPAYALDWLGFHYPSLRYSFRKLLIYRLRNGTHFVARPYSYDRIVIDEIFMLNSYTRYFDIEDGDIVVDLGAHIGAFSIFAAKKAQTVYSYEPEPINFAILKANIRLNNLETKIRAYQKAVAGRRGILPLYVNETGIASTVSPKLGVRKIFVEAITLGDIFVKEKLPRIDFLKVDIEGAEWEVFNIAAESGYLTRVKKIAMECHSVRDTSRLINLLETFGFNVRKAPSGHHDLFYIYAIRY